MWNGPRRCVLDHKWKRHGWGSVLQKAGAFGRDFEFALGATNDPCMDVHSQRLQAQVEALSLCWRSQRVDLEMENVTAHGYLVRMASGGDTNLRTDSPVPACSVVVETNDSGEAAKVA